MAKQTGVSLEKLQGGLARLAAGTDNHVAIIASGVPVGDVATAINNAGKGVAINSVFEAEELGITASFDANEELTLHDDIVDFFRLAPEATLYLFNSAVSADLKAFINHNKEIKGYALAFDYVAAAGEDPANLVSTINAHQTIINELAAENRLIDFAILGPNGMDDFSEDLLALNAPNVSVVVACKAADGITALGAALGMIAVRKVNENMASVDIAKKPRAKRGSEDYPLTDAVLGVWLEAYLTDGTNIEALASATFNAIRSNGYITVAGYEGYPGYFFENSYTCIAETSDFAYIENNRVWNKAARIIRAALLPKVKGVVKKDITSGYIVSTTAANWKTIVDSRLQQMVIDDEISGFETVIDYKQIVNNTNPCKVKASIVADGIVHEFEVAIGLTNNI